MACSNCANSCTGVCATDRGACTCGGNCTSSTCSGGCKGCGSGCSGRCTGCGSGCASGCSGCGSGCASSCSGCSGSCSNACNTGCTSSTQTTSFNALTATSPIHASEINELAAFIYRELQRRGVSATQQSVSVGGAATAALMTTLKTQLSSAGQTASYTATAGNTIQLVLINDLITKAKAAYNTLIPL